jgi:hypothetical protein
MSGRRQRIEGIGARAARAAALVLVVSLAPPAPAALWAQESPAPQVPGLSETDIFGGQAFDQAVAQSKQQEQTTKLEYLVGGVFLMDNQVGTTAAFDSYDASGSFSGKGFVKLSVPQYGSVYLGANFRHFIYQGQEGLSGPSAEALEDLFELSEFYLSFDLDKMVFFRIGDQLIAWGPSVIWTPVDFINLEKADSQASVDLRVGKPGLRLHVPLKKSNVFLFTDFSGTVTGGTVNELLRHTNYGLRWDLTALGFEFGLTGYLGADIQNRLGFDLSGRLLGTDLYGEAALALPHGGDELACAFSTGLQRTFGDLKDWSLQGELFYNSAGEPDETAYPALVSTGKFVPFYVGRLYAYAGLTKQNLVGTVLDGTLSGFMNISDLSYSLSLKGSFDIPRVIPFSVSLGYTGGGAGKEFTYYTGDNGLSASVQVRFEF